MSTKRIIPCLDVTDGRVVKGVKYVDHVDAGDPVAQAANYDQQGADELVFLDITATLEHRALMIDIISQVAQQVSIPLTVGGGVRSVDDMQALFDAGADKASVMTAAVNNPELISQAVERFGPERLVVAIDAQRVPREGRDDSDLGKAPEAEIEWVVYSHGGYQATKVDAVQWAVEAAQRGAAELLITSMDADGTKGGYDLELLRRVKTRAQVPVIASGGAGSVDHLYEALTAGQADAVLAASIFHFGELTVGDVKRELAARGVAVRL
jgi:cyclase